MSDMNDPDVLEPITRTCQIIVLALIMGVASFLAIVMFLVPTSINPAPAPAPAAGGPGAPALPGMAGTTMPLITYIAVGMGVAGLVLSFVIPSVIVASARRKIAKGTWTPPATRDLTQPAQIYPAGDTGGLAYVYQTQLIIGSALSEGMAFFATIAYMLERNPLALGMALILLASLIIRFPTRGRVNAWIDQEQSKLQKERQADF
jgi:hypothetical protein